MGNFKKTFTDVQESELVEYVKLMEGRLFGLTTKDLRRLAFQLAEQNNIQHNFKNIIAGLDWLKGFLKRHQDLSLRSPEPTSVARAMGFNKTAVSKFFTNLVTCLDKYKIQPHRIYNVDETAITTVPKCQSKIIAQKGRRQVGTLTSAERGQTVTAELCFSASGHYVPPLLVFPRVRMKAELLDGASLGTVAACHKSGWMQSDIFVQWLKHFASHVKPSIADPVLLLLDGHATHTKNIEVINYGRANGIVMLCFPPHCTHCLQALDVSFMAPLSAYYSQEQKSWLRNNLGRVVTQFHICKLFGRAYEKAATVQTATSGFRKTGIYPTDPNIFGDADFAAAETTERERDSNENTQFINNDVNVRMQVEDIEQTEISIQQVEEEVNRSVTSQPGSSGLLNTVPNTIYENDGTSRSGSSVSCPSTFSKSPKDLFPVPQALRSAKPNCRKRGKTVILTESPYENELEEALDKQKKQCTAVKRNLKGRVKQKKAKKQKKGDISCDRENEEETEKKKKKQRKQAIYTSSDDNNNEGTSGDEEMCVYCHESYYETKKDDGWVQCVDCTNWAHEGCTGLEEDDLVAFQCRKCNFS
ncbi:uncharacterized protein LOC116173619 [Photinus pyralis]|nr:uncharacterized protein LOC116173619 [Photinus pyralis]